LKNTNTKTRILNTCSSISWWIFYSTTFWIMQRTQIDLITVTMWFFLQVK